MDRRSFLINNSKVALGVTLVPATGLSMVGNINIQNFKSNRPLIEERTFTSDAVETVIKKVKSSIADPELAWIFENCYPNTLDTTVDYEVIDGKPDSFVITGDIDAMWLRDSTAQVWPYMPLIEKDPKIKNLILGLINRQVKCILTDPYANAFYKDLTRISKWSSDIPSPKPGVHECKWEIDSLCYFIRLSYHYYKISGDTSFMDSDWDKAMRLVVDTFRTEQRIDSKSPYSFTREHTFVVGLAIFNGTGAPTKATGMIHSIFRPSDDGTILPYLIPSNIFAYVSLAQLSELYAVGEMDTDFSSECMSFSIEVKSAVEKYAVKEHLDFGKIYAYEVDGFGNALFMDDANVPSLMSLAYIGGHAPSDSIYKNTRAFLLSDSNPYFLRGKVAEGQASPHTGKENIWPMGIILRGLTSEDDSEISKCLKMLKGTHADTGFMHESFHKDDAFNFSRSWFSWANTLFGEFVIKVYNERPWLLNKNFS
ncbi:MAG: metal-independent alpha-mannosidase [Flavobacteriaceae bacterium]|nr:metal-independent alpha-mannosidase [Flavobacteriaceae bacterium]